MIPNSFRSFLSIGILFSVLSVIADLLLLYNPQGGYEKGTYDFLKTISIERVQIGAWLGILCLPIQLAGIWVLSNLLQRTHFSWGKILWYIAFFLMFPGVVYHAGVYCIALLVQDSSVPLKIIEALRSFLEQIAAMMVIGFFVVSGIFSGLVLSQKTIFPLSMLLVSPIFTYGFCFLFYLWLPSIGNFLIPAGFNLSLLILFLFLYFFLLRQSSKVS